MRPEILVVDDDHVTRRILCDSLSRAFTVREAASFGEGRDRLNGNVRLVITDVMLPDGSGLDILVEAKRRRPECLVYVMTGGCAPEVEGKAWSAGADAFIRKPFAALIMAHRIERMLTAP